MNALIVAVIASQLMAPQKQAALTGMLPRLEDRQMDAVLRHPDVLWYTNEEVPAAFQHAVGNGYVETTFHYAFHNFSGDADERQFDRDQRGEMGGGNANREFPWTVAPGGAHNAEGVNSFKGLLLPMRGGRKLPMVYFRQDLPARGNGELIVRGGALLPRGRMNGYNRGWGWIYPVGTVFVEALTMRDSRGFDHVFSVRFRIRERDSWGVEIFRPFATHDQLTAALKDLPGGNAKREAAIRDMQSTKILTLRRLIDRRHRRRVSFDVTAGIDKLPPLEEADVIALIRRPFVSCLGETWRTDGRTAASAPSNETGQFNIVPPDHFAAFSGNERVSCMKCHETVNFHATVFEQPRGWYGRVRGSDGIFSFHPIDPRSIARDGVSYPVRIRQSLIDAGIVEAFNPQRHDRETYHKIKGLY